MPEAAPTQGNAVARQPNGQPLPAWWNQGQVDQWFNQLLGRPEVNPDSSYLGHETGGHYGQELAGGAKSMDDVYNIIYNSQEGQAHRKAGQAGDAGSAQSVSQQPAAQAQDDNRGDSRAPAAPAYSPYQFTQRTLPTYTAPTLSKYQAPNNSGIESSNAAMIQKFLTNPETLSPELVASLKEKNKEEALAVQQQAMDANRRDAVTRGIGGGGFEAAGNRRAADALVNSIIQGNRGIDIQKANQDTSDRQAVANLVQQYLNGSDSRALADFNATHTGEMDQEKLNQAQIASLIQQLTFGSDQEQRQADENFRSAGFGENQRQFDAGQGFQYTALNAQLQQALINALLNS